MMLETYGYLLLATGIAIAGVPVVVLSSGSEMVRRRENQAWPIPTRPMSVDDEQRFDRPSQTSARSLITPAG